MDESRDPFLVELGVRCRERRLDLRLQQKDVAAYIAMTRSMYSLVEQGRKQRIAPEQLARLADVLETTTDYLLQRSEERGRVP